MSLLSAIRCAAIFGDFWEALSLFRLFLTAALLASIATSPARAEMGLSDEEIIEMYSVTIGEGGSKNLVFGYDLLMLASACAERGAAFELADVEKLQGRLTDKFSDVPKADREAAWSGIAGVAPPDGFEAHCPAFFEAAAVLFPDDFGLPVAARPF